VLKEKEIRKVYKMSNDLMLNIFSAPVEGGKKDKKVCIFELNPHCLRSTKICPICSAGKKRSAHQKRPKELCPAKQQFQF
jgi:hypothetical protein